MKKNILFVAQELSPYISGDYGQKILDIAAYMQAKVTLMLEYLFLALVV